MKPFPGSIALAAGIVAVVGFLIGALVPHLARHELDLASPSHIAAVPVSRETAGAPRTAVPLPQATAPQTVRPIVAPIATPKADTPQPAPTQPTTPVPSPATVHTMSTARLATPAASTTSAPTSRDDSHVNVILPSGPIRIDETATSVGTISWSGSARTAAPGSLAVDVRKVLVAGHRVGPCEQATHLRAVLALGASRVPYQEIGCNGSVANGEMQLVSSSGDGRSFRGAFYSGATKLGDFTLIAGSR